MALRGRLNHGAIVQSTTETPEDRPEELKAKQVKVAMHQRKDFF